MKAGKRIQADDDIVVVVKGRQVIYEGLEDYEPMKNECWRFVRTTQNGRGHYEFGPYKKYCS